MVMNTCINKQAFNFYMICNKDTRKDLADALQIKYLTVGKKIRGETDFKLSELRTIKRRWKLTSDQVIEIFFDGIE